MIKVLIADDNVSFCETLFGVLTKEKDFKVTGVAHNWKDIERKYFETIISPEKNIFIVENAGHLLNIENVQDYNIILNDVADRV